MYPFSLPSERLSVSQMTLMVHVVVVVGVAVTVVMLSMMMIHTSY